MCALTNWKVFAMKTVAHRGSSAYALENTIKSIQLAEKQGAELIEIDVQFSKDKKVVLMHDSSVNRTTKLKGQTDSFTLAQLQKENIPGLDDVLALNLNSKLIIEVKDDDPTIVPKIVTLVNKSEMPNKVIYKSFNRKILKEFKRLAPENERIYVFITSFWMFTIDTGLRFKSADELIQTEYYQMHYRFLNENFIKKIQNAGKKIILWSVNSQEKYQRSKKLKVYAIETDFPDLKFP